MPQSTGQKRLYGGDFNVMHQEWQADGSVVITYWRHDDAQRIQMHVSDLYGPNETVISESTIDHSPPAHIVQRQAQARQP